MIRVTVAIPTVSRISYLREALASVEVQTFRDFEVVVGDNSGCIEYGSAVEQLLTCFPNLNVRVYHHPADIGMIGNGNFLIDVGRGEFWLYLPDDDRLTPNCLATLVTAADSEPRAGIVFSDHLLIDANGIVDLVASEANSRRYGRTKLQAGFHSIDEVFDLALAQVFQLQSMLFRRSVIRALRFSEKSGSMPDLDLQLRLWKAPMEGVVYCAARLNEYRIHAGQVTASGNAIRSCKEMIAILKTNAPDDALEHPKYKSRLAQAYAGMALHEAQAGRRVRARVHSLVALRLMPMSPCAIAAVILSNAPPIAVRILRSGLAGLRTFLRRAK